jgi:hypothetical protein
MLADRNLARLQRDTSFKSVPRVSLRSTLGYPLSRVPRLFRISQSGSALL